MQKSILIFLFQILITNIISAQSMFIEGRIEYSVVIKDNENNTKSKGSYIIYAKDGLIRKEMKFIGGYENTILINNNSKTIYSLYKSNQNLLAVQLDYDDYSKKIEKYNNFILINSNESKKIANYLSKRYEVKYKTEPSTNIFYSEQLQLEGSNIFERFPNIRFVPLSFEIKNDADMDMLFEAERIEIKPIPNSLFIIPLGYKIISVSEFNKIKE